MHRLHALLLFLLAFSCGPSPSDPVAPEQDPKEIASLRSAYANDFLIGAAINARTIRGEKPEALALVKREFNTLTPENVMKWERIHPAADSFHWAHADAYVDLGEQNDLFVIGHALVWHSQLSAYAESARDSATLHHYLRDHIGAVAGRYKGRIGGWDVVNEALNENGSLRESVFLRLMGPDYLPLSFKLAAQAAPDADLYYNDYNLCVPEKRAGAIELVRMIREQGGRVDGIGMQGHWNLTEPSLEEIENSILAFAATGAKVMITELDISVLPNPWDLEGAEVSQNFANSPAMNPYPESLPDSVQLQLADRYEAIFRLFRKHRDKISRVTFWGVNDGNSWLNNWPIRGRTNYPLLFDRNYQPKPAYARVMGL